MRDASLGALSYLIFALIVMHPFFGLPPPYGFIFDFFFLVWAIEFCYCWFVVYWLYSRGPKNAPQLFRFGVWLILNAAVLLVTSKLFVDKTQLFLETSPSLQKGWLTLTLSGFEVVQNIIGFGLAALGANLSATVITNRWKTRTDG